MDNSVFSVRIISLYGSQPSPVVFACKTAPYGPELQVPVGTRPHLSFCAWKTECLAPELPISMGSRPPLWNNKSLLVPDITCRLGHAIQRD